MSSTFHHHSGGAVLDVLLPAVALLLCAGAYLVLSHRARRRNPIQGWRRWRTTSFLTGIALLAVALLPPVSRLAHHDFRGHMTQHMLIGMYAPLALMLGAPATLLLRALPAAHGRQLIAALRRHPTKLLTNPVTALGLSTGSMALLYFTPLYEAVMEQPALHWLLHAHFLLSGCLFTYVIAGPDPGPARPSVHARLVLLSIAIAAHATISQLMYAGFYIDVHVPINQLRGGAQIMYYGGDIAELLLAAALVATWRPARRPGAVPAPADRSADSR